MSDVLVNLLYVATISIAVIIGLKSLSILAALRRENKDMKHLFDDQLAQEIKNAIVSEVAEGKGAEELEEDEGKESKPKDPLSGLLMEIYDDLYTRVEDEEKERRKSIKELKDEIKKLRAELKK